MKRRGLWIKLGLAGWFLIIIILAMASQQVYAQRAAVQPGNLSFDGLGMSQIQINSAHFNLDWSVIGSGGGTFSSAHFRMNSTVGQPAAGLTNNSHYKACSGFWCGIGEFIRKIFVPITFLN